MIWEVKWNQKQYQKAKKQLFDGIERIQEILAAIGLTATSWKLVVVFFAFVGTEFVCERCSIFSIIGEAAIHPNIQSIEEKVAERHQNWNPSDHVQEFVDLTKEILFIAQGDPNAPVIGEYVINKTVEHVEQASSILWTPEQLALIQENPENLPHVLFDNFYSTGKSRILRHYGKRGLKKLEGKIIQYRGREF